MEENNIYKIYEILENKYYGVPQELFSNELYKDKLNSDAKILYAFLLDRLTLSSKNNWINEKGEVYLIFTRQEVQEKLGLSEKTSIKAFKQLNDCKLIFEKRQGLGKPNLIFVGKIQHIEKINYQEEKEQFKTCKNYSSVPVNNTALELENLQAINTNNINTNISNNNLILSNLQKEEINAVEDEIGYEDLFKENIEYDILHSDNTIKDVLDNIVKIATEVLKSNKEYIFVNSEKINIEVVKSQFLKLKSYHIMYVINCLKNNTKNIKSIKSYIITALYNSLNTFDLDVTVHSAKFINEMYGG